MKRIIIMTAIALPLAFSARAQYIVYDPKSDLQQILKPRHRPANRQAGRGDWSPHQPVERVQEL
jgi:hypothetical protein